MYIYSRKNRPYTVRMRTKDSTVIMRLPNRETSQRGIASKKPRLLIALVISEGRVAATVTAPPILDMALEAIPLQMEKMASIISIADPTATLAPAKRIKWRRANSGRCSSRKDAAD